MDDGHCSQKWFSDGFRIPDAKTRLISHPILASGRRCSSKRASAYFRIPDAKMQGISHFNFFRKGSAAATIALCPFSHSWCENWIRFAWCKPSVSFRISCAKILLISQGRCKLRPTATKGCPLFYFAFPMRKIPHFCTRCELLIRSYKRSGDPSFFKSRI